MVGNKIADKSSKVLKTFWQNNLEIVKIEYDKEIHKERHISPEERLKIIDALRLIWQYYNVLSVNNKFVTQYTKSTI